MPFGEKLRAAMERQGVSQSELARRLEIRSQAVNQWLSGDTTPSGKRLQEIAGALGIRLAELLSETAPAVRNKNLQRAELLSAFDETDDQGREMLLRLARSVRRDAPPNGPARASACVVELPAQRRRDRR
jgi:transcriptional regulator with XRE-family HTH domain